MLAQTQSDTIRLSKDQVLLVSDSLIIPKTDTLIVLKKGTEYQLLEGRHVRSTDFYDSVYQIAKKSRVTKELYDLLITNQPQRKQATSTKPVRSESFFEEYEGKTISQINYTSVDLLGGSVTDTTLRARSNLGRLTNDLHKSTRKGVIYKHLLFNKGDKVNPYKLADTERIIRSLRYIEDVRIVLSPDPDNPENVHAFLIVKDRFPWSADFSSDGNGAYRLGFTNQNILGTGNEFGVGYFYAREESPTHGYDAQYTIRNINNSFIDGTVFTSNNYEGTSKGISFKRNFLAPNIKYYGEVTLEHVEPIRDLIFADSLYEVDFGIDRKSYDMWVGRSFQIGDRKTINTAIRLQHDHFDKRPLVRSDSNLIYHNHHFLVGALSYSKINFLKAKNILSFNITEDIPVGFIYSILLGNDWTEFGIRNYRGFRSSYSSYSSTYGYFQINLESGYFTKEEQRFDQVIQLDGRHFTPLFEVGSAHSRVFTRFHYFNGDNLSIPISQSLSSENRLRSIDGNQINGDKLITLTSEYVVFQPWYFYGFRFATYGNLGIGQVSESRVEQPFKKTYYTLGGGIRIRNESLVFNTFEFRVSLFPNAPTEGQTFYFKVSLSTPQFFQSPIVRKPRIVGLN